MTLESTILLFFTLILFIIKPGPNMIATISRSLSDGFPAGFSMALGVTTGQIIFFITAVFGFSLIEAHLSFLSFLLKSAGSAYLIYIGIKGLLNLEAGVWKGQHNSEHKITNYENFLSSLFICFANPFTILFYAAIIPQIVPLKEISAYDIIFCLMIITTTYIIMHGGVAYMASNLKDTLKNEKIVKRINFIVSLIFIGLGLFFMLTLLPIFNFDF